MNEIENYGYFFARQYGYDLLRRLFMEEPTVELMTYLQQGQCFDVFPGAEDSQALSEALGKIKKYLDCRHFKAGQDEFENLHWDFTRLFIGPESPPAPPWQSVYVSRDKLLFQQATNQVKAFYDRCGFILASAEQEAADHIGFELDFLYHLSSQTVVLIDKQQMQSEVFKSLVATQLEFLQQHLLAFSADFSRNVYNHAETDFYRALSCILQQFLLQDKQYLSGYLASEAMD